LYTVDDGLKGGKGNGGECLGRTVGDPRGWMKSVGRFRRVWSRTPCTDF
jgi:hypothetical protein